MLKLKTWDVLFALAVAGACVVVAAGDLARGDAPPSLATYVSGAMRAWVPPASQPEGEDAARARYDEIASDIAAVLSDPNEPALFDGDTDKHRTALLLASVAASESSYFARVDEGRCLPKECDFGNAFGLWQLHPEEGIALDGATWRKDRHGHHGWDLIADRRLMIRVVLHVMRGAHDPRWTGGDRAARAEAWAQGHPFAP